MLSLGDVAEDRVPRESRSSATARMGQAVAAPGAQRGRHVSTP